MKITWTSIVDTFTGLLGLRTNDSSTVGSTDLTGSGRSNVGNTWMVILLSILFAGSTFFLGRCTAPTKTITQTQIVYKPGVPDSTYGPPTGHSGTTYTPSTPPVYTATLGAITIVAMPDLVETVIADTTEEATINIRATAYPWVDNDTLRVDQIVEYNVEVRPLVITIHDSIGYPEVTYEQVEVPWIEKPETVASGVSIAWLLLIIFVL